ncbi:MAG TPA: gephyrin-like molybdotransferase Glp [Candidatus Sulfotelmatobacter sp.]|nr:gephyrin-like molybdotransferase Glp [Candidatus Sulfotelmatobacter sp.]
MIKLKGFQKLTSVDEALKKWFDVLKITKPEAELVLLDKALNRVLAEDVIAEENLPRFDRSAVDGYALAAETTLGASQFKPVSFKLVESDVIDSKQVKRVWTGNPLPKGADTIVMIENTRKENGAVKVEVQLAPGDNVVKKGEDVKKDELIITAGTRLNPYHLALLAAFGENQVSVTKKPRIAVLATGNELASVGSKPAANQIYESNTTLISAMCLELDSEPIDLGIAKDDLNEITQKIKRGLSEADAVITTGGTSVGGLDLVPDAVNEFGKPGIIVHGMAMRPGMPTALAMLEDKPVMILSGNPVAAIIGFEVFVRPLICRLLGMKQVQQRPIVKAFITRRVSSALGRKTFVRVKVFEKNGEVFAEPVSARGSGAISTMTRGNGFVVVPEDREGVAENELVTVRLFGNMEMGS